MLIAVVVLAAVAGASAGGKAQLTVLEDTPLLNTDSAELGNVISRHSMEELPVSRQNFSLLGLLVPGTNRGQLAAFARKAARGTPGDTGCGTRCPPWLQT